MRHFLSVKIVLWQFLTKKVLKQAIGEAKRKTEIMAISNRYKDTLKNLIDSLNINPLNILKPVNKKSCNVMLGFKDPLIDPKLDKNISNGS